MSIRNSFIIGYLLLGSALALAQTAYYKTGQVFCDANANGIVDAGDAPVQSALVVVTNLSGTVSNANWTTAEGYFVVTLPGPDTYVDFVHPLTLPAGTLGVTPLFSTFTITASQPVVTNNFYWYSITPDKLI